MKTYRIFPGSNVLLPTLLIILNVTIDDRHEVVRAWTDEGGTYPLQDVERAQIRRSLAHQPNKYMRLVKDHALPSLPKT